MAMLSPRMRFRLLGLMTLAAVILGSIWWLPGPGRTATATANDRGSEYKAAGINLSGGRTPLMLAARKGDIERAKDLLAAGANVNRANNNGGTPLMYAALSGRIELVELFLVNGADVDAAAKNGWTPLMIAASKGFDDIAGALLKAGADANLADVYRWTPLMRASFERRLEIVKLLLSHPGTDPDRQGENGITALHIAASQGFKDVAELLVAAHARKDIRDRDGMTPYAVAVAARHDELIPLLEK